MATPAPTPDAAERVLTAAATLIAERGYGGTTTRAIAEAAGVNEVTIFRRFGTKAGVLAALGQRLAEAFFALTSSFVLGQQLLGRGPLPRGPALEHLIDQLIDLYWTGAAPPAAPEVSS